MNKHRSCPTHCCQIHGCKYGFDDCPVETGKIIGYTGKCENCGLEHEYGHYRSTDVLTEILKLCNESINNNDTFTSLAEDVAIDREKKFAKKIVNIIQGN